MSTFEGFTREAIDFLADLATNNDRAWFQARKADYERLLKAPLEELCVALAGRLADRGVPMVADPARSPFRIYRDVRFSNDKSPYKTHVSASFPWREGGVERSVGGYFHFEPGEMYMGGGMWHPEPPRLRAWRELVATDPGRVHAAIDDAAFVAAFGEVEGESLKRVPPGYPSDHPEADLLRLKDVTFGRRLSDDDVLSPELPETLAAGFAAATPVMTLLGRLGPSEP